MWLAIRFIHAMRLLSLDGSTGREWRLTGLWILRKTMRFSPRSAHRQLCIEFSTHWPIYKSSTRRIILTRVYRRQIRNWAEPTMKVGQPCAVWQRTLLCHQEEQVVTLILAVGVSLVSSKFMLKASTFICLSKQLHYARCTLSSTATKNLKDIWKVLILKKTTAS